MLTLYRPFSNLLRDDTGPGDWSSFFGNPLTRGASSFSPAVDVLEKDGNYLLKAEVPGLAPEDIQVEIEQNVLNLKGERKYEHEEENAGYRRVERRYGSFVRSFVLPDGTNADAIEAKVENGILTVTIPRVQAAPPRKVEVKGEGIVEKAKKIFGKSEERQSV
jgi:HSP20 family protein